ncbi:MAG: hypothetical protein V4649_15330 [Bacteroidota bacterium]
MGRAAFVILLCILLSFPGRLAAGGYGYARAAVTDAPAAGKAAQPNAPTYAAAHAGAEQQGTVRELRAAPKPAANTTDVRAILWLFFQALFAGLLAVFTPFVYTIHPFTIGYLTRNVKTDAEKVINPLFYALSLIIIFTALGALVSLLITATNLPQYTEHWIFNLFFFRIFLTLGISFLGVFSIKLPAIVVNAMAKKAQSNNYKGIFFMAATLPIASFSSTFPIVGLVLLLAGAVPFVGPLIGLLGFSVGLSLPFVFPVILSIFMKSKALLNNTKVVLGFFSLMIALKFAAKADAAFGLNIIERDIFIMIWMTLWVAMGAYMLGLLQLKDDTETEQNIYGQEFTALPRLFLAIAAFTFAVYLLPGIWGAPLKGVSNFLPLL